MVMPYYWHIRDSNSFWLLAKQLTKKTLNLDLGVLLASEWLLVLEGLSSALVFANTNFRTGGKFKHALL